MIIIPMDQKQGLNKFGKLPDDGDPRAPNNGAKEKHQLNPDGPSYIQVAPAPTNYNE